MDIHDEFTFKRFNCFDQDENTLTRVLDLTSVTDVKDKMDKVVETILTFLIQSGFKDQDLLATFDAYLGASKAHPDNDDFTYESRIEEAVKDKDNFYKFLNNLDNLMEAEETDENAAEALREVYRRWLIVDYMNAGKKGVTPSKD